MRAYVFEAYGGPEVERFVDVEDPRPQSREVLVRVAAAGVNPMDWKVRSICGARRLFKPPFLWGERQRVLWNPSGLTSRDSQSVIEFSEPLCEGVDSLSCVFLALMKQPAFLRVCQW